MIWLAWRQFRTQALVVAGLLVVFATALAINGSHLVHLYDTTVATCAQRNDCVSARARFQAQAKWHNALDLLVPVSYTHLDVYKRQVLSQRMNHEDTTAVAHNGVVTGTA